MGLLKGLIGALIGGAIGAGIWAAVICKLEVESGWIAWIVGGLCGLGAAVLARGDADNTTGAIAALVALVSVCAGKYFAVHYIVQDLVAHHVPAIEATEADGLVYVAFQVADEYSQQGMTLKWDEGKSLESVETIEDFPANLRKDVNSRWEAMTPTQRQGYVEYVRSQREAERAEKVGMVESEGFFSSFSPFDILFFFLAVATAYKVGSGSIGGDGD